MALGRSGWIFTGSGGDEQPRPILFGTEDQKGTRETYAVVYNGGKSGREAAAQCPEQ